MKITKSKLRQIIAEELGEAQSVMGVPRNRADLPIEALELSEEIVTKFGIRREAAQKIVGWLVEEQLLKL